MIDLRFAHFADTHLGFQKQEPLQKIEQQVFEEAMDRCMEKNVDFILMCGDLFHTNIPDMRVQKIAMKKFSEIHKAKIPVYAVYGSHDFSPTSSSTIDLLESAGFLTKVTVQLPHEELIRLDFLEDKNTGARLAGLSGLKAGRDIEYHERLDREYLESQDGFKIFMFHGAITEMLHEESGDSMAISNMPRGMDYYAGGHMHTYQHHSFPGYDNVVYPGTMFAGYHSDIENSAKGVMRGFAMVDFEDKVKDVRHEVITGCQYKMLEINGENKSSASVSAEIHDRMSGMDVREKVVILKAWGEMGEGRTSDIDFQGIYRQLLQNGAYDVLINRSGLSSREYKIEGQSAGSSEQIEHSTFQENIGQVRMKRTNLIDSSGVQLSKDLLGTLRQLRPDNETKSDYDTRMTRDGAARMEGQ